MGEPIRLQKILATAGFGSRRGCEVFITEGRVSVDGAVVVELGAKADVESQSVELDGRKVAGPGKLSKSMRENDERVYYALNKPKGALCTNDDPAGRPVAVQMIPEKRRIFCVGRLDLDTEGLILLTNDGDLTNRLTHPRYGVPKTYLARVEGDMGPAQMRRLQTGMHLAEGRTQGAKVRVRRKEGRHCVLEITISEGMNRQVRRMLARVELKCRALKRIGIGPIKLGEMEPGEYRKLTTDELERLNIAISEAEQAGKAPKPERAAKPERDEKSDRFERSDRNEPKRDRADKNAFKKSERSNDVDDEDEEDLDEEFDDDDEDAFAAASKLVEKTGGKVAAAASTKRRVVDSDDDEEDEEELDMSGDDEELDIADTDDEEDAELLELERKDAEADSDDEEDDADDELDDLSTHEAVKAMDENRPWEKVAAKGGKAWADRGDTVHDPELVAAAAEHDREAARLLKEKMAGDSEGIREVRDRGVKSYQGDKRAKPSDRAPRAGRTSRPAFGDSPRPSYGSGGARGGSASSSSYEGRGASKPYEKRGGRDRDAKPVDGEQRPREYGTRGGHTPRPWEKTKVDGANRRPSYNKPRERDDRGGSSSGGGERKPWVKREGAGDSRGGDRPRTFSKPSGFDRGGDSRGGSSSGERKPWVKGAGDSRGVDRPRTFSKPGGYDRGGDRPRDSRERGARPEGGSSSRSRPWENARPQSGERSEGGGGGGVRPWEKKRED